MKLPNGFGSVYKLSGKRRNPYAARKTTGWNGLTMFQIWSIINLETGLKDSNNSKIIVSVRIENDRVIISNEEDIFGYNFITSAYGKNNYDNYVDNLLKDKKIRVAYNQQGVGRPRNVENNSSYNGIISEGIDNVNNNFKDIKNSSDEFDDAPNLEYHKLKTPV